MPVWGLKDLKANDSMLSNHSISSEISEPFRICSEISKKGTCFIYFPSAACLLPAQLCPEMQWESQKSSGGNPEQHCKSHGKNGTPGFGPETSETFETHKV